MPAHGHGPRAEPVVSSDGAYARAAGFFRAAGDAERLRLLARLSTGEWCVTELAQASATSMSTVSQRLRVLRNGGLVTRRRDGKHLYYRLTDEHVTDLITSALAHAEEPSASRTEQGAHP